jgi:hypothetical protein
MYCALGWGFFKTFLSLKKLWWDVKSISAYFFFMSVGCPEALKIKNYHMNFKFWPSYENFQFILLFFFCQIHKTPLRPLRLYSFIQKMYNVWKLNFRWKYEKFGKVNFWWTFVWKSKLLVLKHINKDGTCEHKIKWIVIIKMSDIISFLNWVLGEIDISIRNLTKCGWQIIIIQ